MVLRNEDLDPERSRREYWQAAVEDLEWLGLDWSEGPDRGGLYGPYSQSERRDLYVSAWRRLLEAGWIYPCRCTRADLSRVAQAPHEGAGDEEAIYPGLCRPKGARSASLQVASSVHSTPRGYNWRFAVPQGEVVQFIDVHYGAQTMVAGRDFGDFVVWRRDDVPAYQLAVVVDDHTMQITEVVRGRDLLVSTARQILLYRALGYAEPSWFHCPLVVDAQGQRLAKRNGALALRTLRAQGLSPQAALALAGPNHS